MQTRYGRATANITNLVSGLAILVNTLTGSSLIYARPRLVSSPTTCIVHFSPCRYGRPHTFLLVSCVFSARLLHFSYAKLPRCRSAYSAIQTLVGERCMTSGDAAAQGVFRALRHKPTSSEPCRTCLPEDPGFSCSDTTGKAGIFRGPCPAGLRRCGPCPGELLHAAPDLGAQLEIMFSCASKPGD